MADCVGEKFDSKELLTNSIQKIPKQSVFYKMMDSGYGDLFVAEEESIIASLEIVGGDSLVSCQQILEGGESIG